MISLPDLLSRANGWMNTVNTTSLKILSAIGLAVGSGVFYFSGEFYRLVAAAYGKTVPTLDPTLFGLWLAFVAGCWGFAYKQYAKKRDTYAAPSPDSERTDVPSSPAPTTAVSEDKG